MKRALVISAFWPIFWLVFCATPVSAQQPANVSSPEIGADRRVTFRLNAPKAQEVVLTGELAAEIRKLKQQPGPGMAILGSGSIVAQLAPEGLIDEYQVVMNPVVLGKGRTMFDGIKEKLPRSRPRREPSTMGRSTCATSR